MARELGIAVVPLNLRFGSEVFRDGVDMTAEQFYERLSHNQTLPVPSVPLVQRLYREVGEPYPWVDRWKWSTKEWQDWVAQIGYGIWVLTYDGDLAGFFEFTSGEDGSVEISLFGLVKQYHGRGLGKHLLTSAVDIAWAIGASRVWLHTCTLDDPRALPNYLARGFTEFKKETYQAEV